MSCSNSNSKSNEVTCFECESTKNLVKECSKMKKKYHKKNKKKQIMVAKRSESEGSIESKNEDGQSHLCLIANSNKRTMKKTNLKRY